MRLLINTSTLLSPKTGVGVYTLNVAKRLSELNEDTTFFSGRFTRELEVKELEGLKGFLKRYPLLWNTLKKLAYGLLSRSSQSFDLYFEPNFIPMLRVKSRAVITTVHDLSFLRRDWLPEHRYLFFKENFPKYLGRSDAFVVPSEFVKGELVEVFGIDTGKVRVIYHGIDDSVFFPSQSEKEKFILFVGSLQPRKNLKALLDAYKLLPDYVRREFKLKIVGAESWKSSDLFKGIRKLGDRVEVMDSVRSDEELAKLYRKAYLFVFPSLYEGFGFPPLEAMACGCPVAVSNVSSLPEVCGDAALYFNPREPEEVSQAMQRLIEDSRLREELIIKGIKRARSFSWDSSALSHYELFREFL